MLRQRLSILFSLFVYVTADAEPVQSIYTRNDDPKWMPFECKRGIHCPLMQRRQRKYYSEICISSSPNWYRFRWEKYASHFDVAEAKSIIHSLTSPFFTAKFLKLLYFKNRKHFIEKSNQFYAFVTHLKFDGDKKEYIVNHYLMIPKLSGGEFQIPCNSKDLGPLMNVLGSDNCSHFLSKFVKVEKAPKCFYAVENGKEKNKLQQKIGWDQNEVVKTGIVSDELTKHEWHLAPDNLYKDKDEE